MCKILAIAGLKPEHLPKVHKLAKVAAKNMSYMEDDGVGYAAITKDGDIYGEKWLNKDDAFNIHCQPKPDIATQFMNNLFGNMAEWVKPPVTDKVYDAFGYRTQGAVDTTVAIILHARKATMGSSKTIENVHPFNVTGAVDHPDTAIIHNGSILNHAKLTKTMSTCDSEVILHEYLANMMYHNPWGIEQVAKTLIGEYAIAALSSTIDLEQNILPFLDIFKSGKDLHAAYIPEIDAVAFCTSDTTLENACREVDMTVKCMIKIKDGHLLRINAITGLRELDLISFTPSAKWENDHTKNHHNSMVRPMGPNAMKEVGPDINDDITETGDNTIESAKKHFERRYPSLFTMPYLEVNGKLEEHERALFTTLANNHDTNHKALHLVSVALSAKA